MKPVCLVIGAGAGIGGNVARRFAQEGYHACLCRRSDLDGLNRMVTAIKSDGGSATGFLLNAIEANSIEERVAAIEADIGPIEVVVYNLGAQIGDRALKNTSLKAFETGWRLGTLGLFRLASAVCPLMEARGKGTILVTSATAAMRGNGGQHSHAAAMGGRRMLCQTLNAEFASKGIHVVHIVIDGCGSSKPYPRKIPPAATCPGANDIGPRRRTHEHDPHRRPAPRAVRASLQVSVRTDQVLR